MVASLVGCNDDNKKDTSSKAEPTITEENKISDEEVLAIYNSNIDEVKAFMTAHNISYTETTDDEGNLFLKGETSSNDHNTIVTCSYRLFKRTDKYKPRMDAHVLLAVDKDKINSEDLKFQDTVFGEFRKIFVDKELDVDAVNESIRNYYTEEDVWDNAYVDRELDNNCDESVEFKETYMNYAWGREFPN